MFGLGWYVRGTFPGLATPVSYLIDTGTFGVFVPQEFLDTWGDPLNPGTPLCPDLALGDRLVSVNGVPWVPGPGDLGEQPSQGVRLTWEWAGHLFETTHQRQEVVRP